MMSGLSLDRSEMMADHYHGRIEGTIEAIETTNVVTRDVDYLFRLTLDNGVWVFCIIRQEIHQTALGLNGCRARLEGWILQNDSGDAPVLIAADIIEPA